jgi:hypothetical protein
MTVDDYLRESQHLDRLEAGMDRLEATAGALRHEIDGLVEKVRRAVTR